MKKLQDSVKNLPNEEIVAIVQEVMTIEIDAFNQTLIDNEKKFVGFFRSIIENNTPIPRRAIRELLIECLKHYEKIGKLNSPGLITPNLKEKDFQKIFMKRAIRKMGGTGGGG